ncbi:MAG: hypothetical protein ACPGJS_03425 [Flammeovirgaceae bacterium]
MKVKILGSILLIFSTLYVFGQYDARNIEQKLKAIQTTQAEYDYMMIGYQEQQAFGLDMKAGYELHNEYSAEITGYVFTAKDLIRKETNQYVGTMIHVKAPNGKEEYIGIPYMNEDLMDIHKVHLTYIMRNKRLYKAYSEFYTKRMAVTAAKSF